MAEDSKIIERRDSLLKACGLHYIIHGARQMNPNIPVDERIKPSASRDHFAALMFLIEKGAKVNAKDLAGQTPLHQCTTSFCTALTLKMAKFLIRNGADVNLPNRLGRTAIFSPTELGNETIIDFLINNGARTDCVDNDGVTLSSLIPHHINIRAKFSKAINAKVKREQHNIKMVGSHRCCANCGSSNSKCRKCSGCFMAWYCGSECQIEHRQQHRADCKQVMQEYVEVKLRETGSASLYHLMVS